MSEPQNHNESKPPQTFSETLRQGAIQETEELVKFELDVEALAGREALLINAYLVEDVEAAKYYWQELKQELLLQAELRAESWLASVASPAVIDWLRLDFCMRRAASQLFAGEVAVEQELCCANCGRGFSVHGSTTLTACHSCGSEVFAARSVQVQ
jgi:DNA-directed RNA polymerase subunit RPC12/RpoP